MQPRDISRALREVTQVYNVPSKSTFHQIHSRRKYKFEKIQALTKKKGSGT